MKLLAAALAAALLVFTAESADAALTSSEQAQIRDFVAAGKPANAHRVRSLVARTDLSADESVAALTAGVAPIAFSEPRAAFLKELVFGGASAPSRPLLARATVRALLARAQSVYQRYVGGLDHEPRAIAELVAIYGFIDGVIANAGSPTSASHDPNAGIPTATYEDCSKALRDHVENNARWLKGDGAIPESVGRLRAQAQAALIDMLPDGLTRRVDAADRLGLKGARRQVLTEWGILLADAGKLDEAQAERVREVLARLPGARADLALVFAGADRGPLRARGVVAFVGGGDDKNPFGAEVAPGPYDATVGGITLDLATLAAKRALDGRAELRSAAERDAVAAKGDPGRLLGRPRAPSVDHVVGAAIHLLLTDAPRTIDLAFARLLAGKPEGAGLLADAVGALAASAPPADKGKDPALELGKAGGSTTMTAIRLAGNGTASGFTLDGHAWTIDRGPPSLAVTAVRRDGQPVALGHLGSARTPTAEGTTWSQSGYTFTKLRGSPRVGVGAGGDKGGVNVKIEAGGASGFDAISTPPPATDLVIEGDLTVKGGPGGIAFRMVPTRKGLRGAMLLVNPKGRTVLATTDDATPEAMLGAPLEKSPTGTVHVKITVEGAKVEAVVGGQTLRGTLPSTMTGGDVAIIGQRGATVELSGLVLKRK